MDVVNRRDTVPFTTVDGSTIRELLAHRNSAIRQQSLAEARLPPGAATTPHHHAVTEEIYYITHGGGRMRVGTEIREVGVGDAIAIQICRNLECLQCAKEYTGCIASRNIDGIVRCCCRCHRLARAFQVPRPALFLLQELRITARADMWICATLK